jgi:hypothetical protein
MFVPVSGCKLALHSNHWAELMRRTKGLAALVTATLIAGRNQTTSTATPAATTMDPGSVTVFTLALQSDSVTGCIMGDPGMIRPMTLTVSNNSAVLLTGGGVHYDLNRMRPNVYAGGYYTKIVADLSVRPKRLTVSNDDGSCNWAATTP